MSDIYSTIARYESVCRELELPQNPYVIKMFNKEQNDTALDPHSSMYLYLAGNNRLLTDVRLTDDDARALYETLKNNVYVACLDLRYNNITDVGAEHIAKLLDETTVIKELNLMCNDITEVGAEKIAASLQKNETLKSLKMNGNKFGNKGGMCFAQVLQINTTLEDLDLGDSDQKIESIIALATVLHQNRTLKSLNVNRPLLFTHQEETTVHFAQMLKVNQTLQNLSLQKYEMRDFGVTRLAENLFENFTLTYLDLSNNRITRDGMKELAKVLKKNTALRVLDLGYNRLEDDGAMHVAEALASYNNTLTHLVMINNNVRGRGLCAIADSLKTNTTLSNVYIWGNVLEESACIAFASLIDSGRLEKDNTDVQPYVVDGVTSLSELSNGIRKHYYWTPNYGPDVPSYIPRG